ncbi:MerR family transcriptional regulator [Paenibacillus sp. GCM10027627]|uniref:MerR family transcriptional regulator n=1 Tax=unclassified Paenibacillus TaxID=185978 RepID=UPI0036348C13
MLIGELAKRASVTPRTIRHYQSLGLLGNVAQESNGFHYYSDEALQRLLKINVLKGIGLSLVEIGTVIDLYFEESTIVEGKRQVLQLLDRHLEETDAKLASLTQFRNELIQNKNRIQSIVDQMSPLADNRKL